MKKLVGIALIVCMFFSILLCGCGGKDKGATEVGSISKTDDSSRGAWFKDGQITFIESPQKQFVSGNYAVEKDGWIYYQSNSKTLEKMKNNGSDRVKLCDGEPAQILIAGDWIYFTSDDGIFKVRTDGQDYKRLSTLVPAEMTIDGEWIYFVSDSDSFIYRVKTDGSIESVLCNEPTMSHILVIGDSVYYFKQGSETTIVNGMESTGDIQVGLYKMKTDGTGRSLLDGEKGSTVWMNQDGDWIYYYRYIKHNDGSRTNDQFKIRLDGTGKTKTNEGSISGQVYKDWFYFRDANDLTSLYRMRLDGTEKIKIIGNSPSSYRFKNNYIVYTSLSNNDINLFRIKTDGSDMKQLAGNIRNYTVAGDWVYCLGMKKNYIFSTDGTDREVLASSQAVK